MNDRLAIRRFRCCGCKRTFSWRPAFLVFRYRFAALAYQEFLGSSMSTRNDWWQPGSAALTAVRRKLAQHAQRLVSRLATHLRREVAPDVGVRTALKLAQEVADLQSTHDNLRCSCHILFLALAWTRSHAAYALTAT